MPIPSWGDANGTAFQGRSTFMLTGRRYRASHLSPVMFFMVLISAALLSACNGSESFRDQVEARIPESGCPNVSGTYVLYGDPLPGMPPYFIVRSEKLALDSMLGLDLKVPEREQLTTVDLRQSTTLEVIARGEFGAVSQKSQWAPEDRVICESGKLSIFRTREVQSEYGKEIIDSVKTISLADDGALLVRIERYARGRWLFVIPSLWRWHEEYGAKFKRVS